MGLQSRVERLERLHIIEEDKDPIVSEETQRSIHKIYGAGEFVPSTMRLSELQRIVEGIYR